MSGPGQSGAALATALDERLVNVKIIEKDGDRCARVAESLTRALVIKGDGTDKSLLLEENIQNSDFVVSMTGKEESNVLISLLAKRLGARRTVTRRQQLGIYPHPVTNRDRQRCQRQVECRSRHSAAHPAREDRVRRPPQRRVRRGPRG